MGHLETKTHVFSRQESSRLKQNYGALEELIAVGEFGDGGGEFQQGLRVDAIRNHLAGGAGELLKFLCAMGGNSDGKKVRGTLAEKAGFRDFVVGIGCGEVMNPRNPSCPRVSACELPEGFRPRRSKGHREDVVNKYGLVVREFGKKQRPPFWALRDATDSHASQCTLALSAEDGHLVPVPRHEARVLTEDSLDPSYNGWIAKVDEGDAHNSSSSLSCCRDARLNTVPSWRGPQVREIQKNRGDRIRTCDLLVPNQALYQAKLHPESNDTLESAVPDRKDHHRFIAENICGREAILTQVLGWRVWALR